MVEQRVLVGAVVGPVQPLLDVLVGVGVRRDVDALRVLQQVLREAADMPEKRRAVHQRLARRGDVIGDRVDVVDETEVEHPVGFVQDEHFDVVEHGLSGLQVIEQPPRRRDQDVERTAQRLDLRRIRHAADHRRDPQALHMAAIGAGSLGNLHRQLAGRRQDEDAGTVDRSLVASLRSRARHQDALQCGKDERGGLAAPGARRDHQVGAQQGRRYGGALHRCRAVVAGIGHGAGQGFVQAQGFEGHHLLSCTRRHAPQRQRRKTAAVANVATAESRWKERPNRRPEQAPRFENSQSDGIAANRSREGFEQATRRAAGDSMRSGR